jgi:hypothetical protein
MVLVGRVKMAQAIQMPESEWAQMLSEVERDPLFQELLGARSEGRRIVRFKRFAHTGISGQFYEMQDAEVVGNSGDSPETLLDRKRDLLKLIERIGQKNFEKYFLYRDENDATSNVAAECGITTEEVKRLQDFILDMSVQAEFYHPTSIQESNIARPTLIGRIIQNDDKTYSISFFSPHLARGMYDIDRSALRLWQKDKKFDRKTAAKLRRYIGILEVSNLKQGAFWRVIDFLLREQKPYFDTRDVSKMSPVSLRKVAQQLQFAPSTISRVLAAKSVMLPWDREVMLASLMPGQRRVVLGILEKVASSNAGRLTDKELAALIAKDFGVSVSRRTITACRHVLDPSKRKSARPGDMSSGRAA